MSYHIPVLLDEAINALNIRDDGFYIDATAGGGGHAFAIASKLTAGRLIALDRDPDAVKEASKRLEGLRATVVLANFTEMASVLHEQGIKAVDGILMDIGVSSHQLDAPERGFSYHADAPLDMRMSQSGKSAAQLINTLDEQQLTDIFFKYGEEKYSRYIARAIIRERQIEDITTTGRLAEIIKNAVPAKYRRQGHPARRVFQALRIEVNDELNILSAALDTAFSCLSANGRLAVITFHSLEDRIVKRRFSQWCRGCVCPPDFPICVCGKKPDAHFVLKKPVQPSGNELESNPRSRSAKLRCIEKNP